MSKVDSTSRIDGSNSQGRVMSNFQRIRGALRLMAAAALSLLATFGASAQTVRYVHTDGLGSSVLMTDKDRNVIERSEYEPYGSLLNRPISDGPGYTGHVMDAATGLTYMQQRYYDPLTGRFLSVDPVTAYSNPMAQFNRYWYASNNPYRFKDLDGRAVSCANKECVMTADTFDSAKSTGQTALATSDIKAATEASKSQMGAGRGPETLGFALKGADGKTTVQPASNVKTGKTATGNTASSKIPQGALAAVHGHIDKGPDRSNGMVDDPRSNGGLGDTQGLKANLPVATISQGQVGWHEINGGQLQFTYPQGALSGSQTEQMQNNLDKEQKFFQNP
ncbi:RHS repeat-associated core domain-containing protein [uncultured Xanthomonas sp.]|uniref:RHS repeat-associated core domain-containing protein n=1 Tax=uncultured Xanthomonas sp. TaxID=152831 RepID=UPI0025DB4CA7|nr:RHS repeat-associated core domain-containing protein [uncultured Xanthomonas sp.]